MESVATLALVGGDPALDLVNTLERGLARPTRPNQDFLADPESVLVWAERAGLLAETETSAVRSAWRAGPVLAGSNLTCLVEVREALHTVLAASVDGDRSADPAVAPALEVLRRHWLEAMRRSRIQARGDGPAVGLEVGVEPAWQPLDRAVAAAFDLVRGPDRARLRRCPFDEGGCGWMFVDRTRNGSRRWCRMADCGTQVKSRRLTERRREQRRTSNGGDDDG